MMAWIFAGVMICISIAAALLLRRYGIDRASHEARLATLAATAHRAAEGEAPQP
jgi:GPH family glycoside/pentoside/hexuronide:cation symporter